MMLICASANDDDIQISESCEYPVCILDVNLAGLANCPVAGSLDTT